MVPFKLSERRVWPGCHEVVIKGDLDLAVSGELQEALERVGRFDHVLLDLAACDFVDASALIVLVRAHGRLRHRHRQLLVFGAHGQVRRLLSTTGLIESRRLVEDASRLPVG